MFREAAPQPFEKAPHPPSPEGREGLVGDYAAPSQEEREKHAREIADVKAAIRGLEARLHEIAQMSLVGKLGAMVVGKPDDGVLEKLYKQLRHLEENQRYKEGGGLKEAGIH